MSKSKLVHKLPKILEIHITLSLLFRGRGGEGIYVGELYNNILCCGTSGINDHLFISLLFVLVLTFICVWEEIESMILGFCPILCLKVKSEGSDFIL